LSRSPFPSQSTNIIIAIAAFAFAFVVAASMSNRYCCRRHYCCAGEEPNAVAQQATSPSILGK